MTKRYSLNLSSLQKRSALCCRSDDRDIGVAISFGLQLMAQQEEQRLKADLELLGRAISSPI